MEPAPGAAPLRREGVDRPRRGKAGPAASPRKAHEHRLGDVVLLVAEPEDAHPAPGHLEADEFEAGCPRQGLTAVGARCLPPA